VFWLWLWTWRRKYLPLLMASIAACAPNADVYVLRSPRELERFVVALLLRADPTN
jgi:hypothetical protein